MRVSIIVPVYNEMRFIEELCDCLDAQSFPPEEMEILFLDGRSSDGTKEYLEKRPMRAHKRILDNEKRRHVFALNQGLREATGTYVLRMDGHGWYAPDYVERCVTWLEKDPDAINVGGVARAKGYDFGSSVIAKLMSSKFALSGSSFRYATEVTRADTLFPGAWRREQLLKSGGWDEVQLTSQDVEMSARFKSLFPGKYYLIDPAIQLSYYPRNSIKTLAKQYYRYGYWRRVTVEKHPEMFRRAFIVPLGLFAATLLGLLWALVFAFVFPPLLLLGFAPILVYLLYTFYAASTFIKGEDKKLRRFFYSVGALAAVHYCWSAGFFQRMLERRKAPKDIYG